MEKQHSKALIALMLVFILSMSACSISLNFGQDKSKEKNTTQEKNTESKANNDNKKSTDNTTNNTKDSEAGDNTTGKNTSGTADTNTDKKDDSKSNDSDSKDYTGLKLYEGNDMPFEFKYGEDWTVITENNSADGPSIVNSEEPKVLEEDKTVSEAPAEKADVVKIEVEDKSTVEEAADSYFKELAEEKGTSELETIGDKSAEVYTLDLPTGENKYVYFVEHEGKTITVEGEDKAKLEQVIESIK